MHTQYTMTGALFSKADYRKRLAEGNDYIAGLCFEMTGHSVSEWNFNGEMTLWRYDIRISMVMSPAEPALSRRAQTRHQSICYQVSRKTRAGAAYAEFEC